MAQVRAERAQNAALHHVQAPQQQRNAAHQVEEDNRSHGIWLAAPAQSRVVANIV